VHEAIGVVLSVYSAGEQNSDLPRIATNCAAEQIALLAKEGPMPEENPTGPNPEDFEKFLRDFLAGNENADAAKLAAAAGLPNDPAAIAAMMSQLQSALASFGQADSSGVNWKLALDQAKTIAKKDDRAISAEFRKSISEAISVGSLWLGQQTDVAELTTEPKLLTREMWVADSIALFEALASPIASRMSAALSENLSTNLHEDLQATLGPAANMLKSAGAALYAMQLGQAIGKLSTEALGGSDIGLPIFTEQRVAFVGQNLEKFIAELEVEADQAYIYLAIREMAHARLFKHSKWLREHVVSQIANFASEISIDGDKINEIASGLDPNNSDELKEIIESGGFISEQTDEQKLALVRIEGLLALIEGWVDAVTEDATRLLPKAGAIAEAVRRRRATGGPAEQTFRSLLGLQLSPRKLRESAAMWRAVGAELGTQRRDSLWNHPDVLPSLDDISNPAALIDRLRNDGNDDAFDKELRDLLG
jgi:putative hydrolase